MEEQNATYFQLIVDPKEKKITKLLGVLVLDELCNYEIS